MAPPQNPVAQPPLTEDDQLKGHQAVKVTAAKVSDDKKSVLLVIPDLQPVMQIKITTNIDAAEGSAMKYDVIGTINRVPNYKPKSTTKPATEPTVSVK